MFGYVEILKPLYDAAIEVFAEHYPTASMVIPIILDIQSLL